MNCPICKTLSVSQTHIQHCANRQSEEIADLRAQLYVLSGYAPDIYKCKSCDRYYVSGYVCDCGRDNSYSDKEWAEILRRAGKKTK